MSKINHLNEAHQVLATQQIRIATEQFKAKVDAEIKEAPDRKTIIDFKA